MTFPSARPPQGTPPEERRGFNWALFIVVILIIAALFLALFLPTFFAPR